MNIIIMKEWTTESSLKAIVTFNDRGYYCGYIIVDPFPSVISIPSYPLPYDLDDEELSPHLQRVQDLLDGIEVHGGTTFSGALNHLERPDDYAIGFDCAHCTDTPDSALVEKLFLSSEKVLDLGPNSGIPVSIDYVIEQAESLAKQLADIKKLLLPII